MDKIRRLIVAHVPVSTCNLRCKYCYITIKNKWNAELPKFTHSPEEIGLALSRERLGGSCFVNICGSGETLLPPEIIDIIKNILKQGHYVEVVTNGTVSKRINEIVKLPLELLNRLTFKFSFHYLELKRLNFFDVFFENIYKIKKAGCSFSVEMTPYDELEPYIDDIKDMCLKRLGALCHLTIARDDRTKDITLLSKHSMKDYAKIWGQFNSNMFDFKKRIFHEKRKEFCYAGDWSAYINLGTGEITKCYYPIKVGNIFDDMDKPLNFEAIGKCPIAHCYNGHAFLTFGVIPTLKTPTYADIRNRKCLDGSEWLSPEMKEFMSEKLEDNNTKYSIVKKFKIRIKTAKKLSYHKIRKLYIKLKKLAKVILPKKVIRILKN
jgi:MoaA/NifB/PqqE/SkfB family radical SAM enzyme